VLRAKKPMNILGVTGPALHDNSARRARRSWAKPQTRGSHRLIRELERRTGNAVVLNTSMNRRGEPIVCTPTDALEMFYGSELQWLIMEDLLVTKG
jgi:carbamoyltransferase